MSEFLFLKSAKKGSFRNGIFGEYEFNINGVNIMPKGSEDFQTGWSAFLGTTVVVTPGQADPDGGVGAFRIQTSGGTNLLKYLTTAVMSNFGTPYSHQIWVKVNTEKDVKFSPNTKIGPLTRTVTQTEGWIQVKIHGTIGTGSYNVQIQCQALTIEDALDFTVYQPKIEIGSNCTAYSVPVGMPQTLWNSVKSSIQVTNLIENGNFSVDTDANGIADDWRQTSTNSINFRLENNVQYWTPITDNTWSNSCRTNQYIMIKPNHKYYHAGKFVNISRVHFEIINIYYDMSTDGKKSFILTSPSNNEEYNIISIAYYCRTANIEASLSNILLIDLTEIFGAGNEPTVEFCDQTFTSWFNDVINMNIQGKLIISQHEAVNIVQNGNFVDGVTGWSTYYSLPPTVSENILSATCNGAASYGQVSQNTSIPCNSGKKIYARYIGRIVNGSASGINLWISGTMGGGDVVVKSINSPVEATWYSISGITTLTGQLGNIQIKILQSYTDGATANGKTIEIQYVLAINLTDIFGEGNEPTLIQCDQMFANWFDGTQQVEYKKYYGHGILGSTESDDTNDPLWIKEGLQFIDDFVNIKPSFTMGKNPFSIVVIAKANIDEVSTRMLFYKGGWGTSIGYYLRLHNGNINATVNDGVTAYNVYTTDLNMKDNLYHSIIMTKSDKLNIYKDGEFVNCSANFVNIGPVDDQNQPFYIGAYPGFYYWNGVIAVVIPYMVELNPTAIKQIHNYLKGKLFVERGIGLP